MHRIANALVALGLRKGDVLGIILPNCTELLEVYRAAALLGLVAVPLSPLLRARAIATLLRDSEAVATIAAADLTGTLDEVRATHPELCPAGWVLVGGSAAGVYRDYATLAGESDEEPPPVPPIDGADVYNIIYSSGTTGEPKGIVHDHRIRALYGSLFASAFRFTPESVVMHAGSLVFNGAFVTLMPAWLLGCTYVLQQSFDPTEFIETVEHEGVTHVMMVPSQIAAVLDAPDFSARRLRSLRMLCSVGAPWHREHKERMLEALPASLYELYGLTEGFITILDSTDFAAHMDSVGVPIPFSEMRIVGDDAEDLPAGEVGEIVGRGPLLMRGYHGRPDLTSRTIVDGWLYTGDAGCVDGDGFLHLVDRRKDVIISGGVNIFPRDIEEVAARHASVREVAVFGVPHERWGEVPVAQVVLRAGADDSREALRDWINERVGARYQRLHDVVIADDLPRGVTGKTLKRVLRDEYSRITAR